MPSGPGVRVDSGVETGTEVSTFYDPILAKIITWGGDRETARRRMVLALQETVLLGVCTPVSFLIDVLNCPAFIEGRAHTGFLEEQGFLRTAPQPAEIPDEVVLAAALFRPEAGKSGEIKTTAATPWTEIGPWKIGSAS
jgi:acetyl/propionyl-CoA carboxylase alpha subunit